MLLLFSGAISNSNAVIRQEFRKLRFQMIDDTCSACDRFGSPRHHPVAFGDDGISAFNAHGVNCWLQIVDSEKKSAHSLVTFDAIAFGELQNPPKTFMKDRKSPNRTSRRQTRRRQYRGLRGKVIELVEHEFEEGTLYVHVRFTDRTELCRHDQ
jgi:hypothetical protein